MSTAPKDGSAFIGAFQYEGETEWEIHEFEWNEYAFDTDSEKSMPMFVRPQAHITSSEDQPMLWQPMPFPPLQPLT